MQTNSSKLFDYLGKAILPFCIGSLLFLNSFTSLRIGGTGPLEILFLLSLSLIILQKLLNKFALNYLPLIALAYLIFFMAPITFYNVSSEFLGSSARTLYALIYGSLIGFAAANTSRDEQKYIAYGIFTTLLVTVTIVLVQFDFNNLQRLLFLSENPNQLALYALGTVFFFVKSIEDHRVLLIALIAAFIYGSLALSDSYFLSIAVILSFLTLQVLLKRKLFLLVGSISLILLLIAWPIAFPDYSYLLPIQNLWNLADQGGGRTTLALNGISAFLSSPIFGHGAGAFSGTEIPFMRFEAHNTMIDFLTMGGLPLLLIVYLPFLFAIRTLAFNNKFILVGPLVAIIVFSVFHFIGRHPIFWFIWGYCILIELENRRAIKCAE
tara:strand:- start:383 stop:1525 length:1143 start_codon:yes stop_codon:yes gene_type:complete